MKTYKLSTRDEVVKFLNDHYYLDVLRDYALTLQHFFTTRKEDFDNALNGSEDERDDYNSRYNTAVLWGIGDDNGLEARFIDKLIAKTDQWIADFDKWLEDAIAAELADPTTVDYEEGDEQYAVDDFIEKFEEKRMDNTFFPYNPHKLMALREESAGLKEDADYHEMLNFYA